MSETRLDKRRPVLYNTNEGQTTHTVAPSNSRILLVYQKHPSLGRVAVAFFPIIHDNRDGILSEMERNTHFLHLLSEMSEQPPACLLFTLLPLRVSVNAISAYCQSVTICIPLCEQNKTRTLTSAGFILFGVLTPRPRTPPPSRRRRWRRHPPFHPRWRTCSPATPPHWGPGRTGRSSRA